MKARNLSSFIVLVICVLVAAPLLASSPRIVRLSFVQGDVRLDRNSGNGLEEAILNSPVPEGGRLVVTDDSGYAEVEFENGSTLRLSGAAEVDFPQLTADGNGHLLSLVNVRYGTAYLDAKLEKHAQYRIALRGGPAVLLQHSSRLRVQVSDKQATVAVFDGEISIPEKEREVNVKKGDTLTLSFADTSNYTIAKSIERQPFDDWNREREGVHEAQFARAENTNNYGYTGYGEGDLLAYGGYTMVPGYGYMWRPNGFDMGWDPFSYGAWSFYPAWGWTFISPYPWGWAPYRYGSWYNVPGYGWMWQPGYGKAWTPVPVVVNPPGSFRPLHPPTKGPGPTTIVGTPPPSGIAPAAVNPAQAAQTPARRPEINSPNRPRATHTPPRAVQMPADAVRDTGAKPTPSDTPAAAPSNAPTPAPAKPAATPPQSMSRPAAPASSTTAMHPVPSHMSAPASMPHMSSFVAGMGHVATSAHR